VDDEQAPFVQVVVVHTPFVQRVEEEVEASPLALGPAAANRAGRPAAGVVEVVHAPFVQIVTVQIPCGLQLNED